MVWGEWRKRLDKIRFKKGYTRRISLSTAVIRDSEIEPPHIGVVLPDARCWRANFKGEPLTSCLICQLPGGIRLASVGNR